MSIRCLLSFCAVALLFSCSKSDETKTDTSGSDKVTQVVVETTKGEFVIDVHSAWSPQGAARFLELVKNGYYNDNAFFRVIPNFMVQTGISGDPATAKAWDHKTIKDDPSYPGVSNTRGLVTFAKAGDDSRTTQFFIAYSDQSRLDSQGFTPFGVVTEEGMKIVDQIFSGYGGSPDDGGRGPTQDAITKRGNAYLKQFFPQLDYITKMTIR